MVLTSGQLGSVNIVMLKAVVVSLKDIRLRNATINNDRGKFSDALCHMLRHMLFNNLKGRFRGNASKDKRMTVLHGFTHLDTKSTRRSRSRTASGTKEV